MTTQEFLTRRSNLLSMLDEYKKTININYHELADRFIQANSPLQKEMVYEPVEKPLVRKPKNSNRFVVYEVEVQMFQSLPYIRVGGWVLDLQNIPLVWKTYTVWGPQFLNPIQFNLSPNQTHLPHPMANQQSNVSPDSGSRFESTDDSQS